MRYRDGWGIRMGGVGGGEGYRDGVRNKIYEGECE